MLKYFKLVPEWFYEVARGNPRRVSRRDTIQPFLVIGHRGSPVKEIENTMASFRRAVDEGANALEFDLCFTADREIVIWHDWDPDERNSLLRESGAEPVVGWCPCPPEGGELRRPVSELTRAELCDNYCYSPKGGDETAGDCIPTLDELLEWVTTRRELVALFFDMKVTSDWLDLVPPMMQCINEALQRYRVDCRSIFETVDIEVLRAMKAHSPQHHYTLDVEPPPGIIFDPGSYSAAQLALEFDNSYATPQRPRATTIAPWTTHRRVVRHDIRLLNKIERMKEEAKTPSIISFTIDEEEEIRMLLKMGVTGIQSNRPELLRRVAEEMGVTIA